MVFTTFSLDINKFLLFNSIWLDLFNCPLISVKLHFDAVYINILIRINLNVNTYRCFNIHINAFYSSLTINKLFFKFTWIKLLFYCTWKSITNLNCKFSFYEPVFIKLIFYFVTQVSLFSNFELIFYRTQLWFCK